MVFEPADVKVTRQLPDPLVRVSVQFVSAPVMLTVPVGVPHTLVTVTLTLAVPFGADGSGVSDVIVVVVDARITLCDIESVLPWCVVSPPYVAVMVFVPTELKTITQLPVPLERVMEQFVSSVPVLISVPVISTVPVGVVLVPLTVTVTVTFCPT